MVRSTAPKALEHITQFHRSQRLLQDRACGTHTRGFAFAVSLHLASAVHGLDRGLLEPSDRAVHRVAAGLRKA